MVAGLIMFQLAVSVLAAAMAWALAHFAGLLGWSRRGVWAAAMLCSLALPVILMAGGGEQDRPAAFAEIASAAVLRETPLPAPDAGEPAAPSELVIAANNMPDAPRLHQRSLQLRLPVFPQWDDVLSKIWMALSAATLCALAAGSLHVRRLLRNLPQARIDGTRVLVSEDLGPAVFGWLRPVIVVPRPVSNSRHRLLVLMHERSHADAHDPLLFGALLAAVALVPWNPLLWWQLRQLRFAIEVDCDRRVLRSGVDVASYGQMLLQVAQLKHSLPLGSMALTEPVSQLGKRVTIMTREFSMTARVRLAVISLGVLGISVAIAAQLEPPQRPQDALVAADPVAAGELEGFQTVSGASGITALQLGGLSPSDLPARLETLQAVLNDPIKRAELREQRVPKTRNFHAGLVEFLDLDPVTGQGLIDLLADQALEVELQSMKNSLLSTEELRRWIQTTVARGAWPTTNQEPTVYEIDVVAANTARHRGALRDLLGQAQFGRYLDYVSTLPARLALARLSTRLGQEDMSREQRESMVKLFMAERGILNSLSVSALQSSQKMQWLLARRDRLVRNAASILTASQLTVLERTENERIDAERNRIEARRKYSDTPGDATIPDAARPAAEQRMLTGRLRWSVIFAIGEAEAKAARFSSNLGEQVAFDAGAGLWVEAKPMAFDTKRLIVDLSVYETDANGGRHLIDNRIDTADFGAPPRTAEALATRRTVMAGSKAYIVAYSTAGSLE